MRYFVQLKDDVVFSYHESSTEVDIPGDNIIQVDSDGENYLNKKYVDGSFIDAPTIKYATLDSNNTVVKINSTLFSSDVADSNMIIGPEVQVLWTWDGTSFNAPATVASVPTIDFGGIKVTTSEEIPALTMEQQELNSIPPEEPEQPTE